MKSLRHSDALDLERDVFKKGSARQIALSLKHSAESSARRKSSPYRSAMSMLTFYINRAGKTLDGKQKPCWKKPKTNCGRRLGRNNCMAERLLETVLITFICAPAPRSVARG